MYVYKETIKTSWQVPVHLFLEKTLRRLVKYKYQKIEN